MKYYKGMKYVTAEDIRAKTDITGFTITDHRGHLDVNGNVLIYKWYPWDGNTGPVFDFKSTLEASCFHDLLCDWINEGLLPAYLQPIVDQEYYKLCNKKGLWEFFARVRLVGVRWFQTGKKKPRQRKVYIA